MIAPEIILVACEDCGRTQTFTAKYVEAVAHQALIEAAGWERWQIDDGSHRARCPECAQRDSGRG